MNINVMSMTHDQLWPYFVKRTDADGKVTICNFLSFEDARYSCNTSAEEDYGLVEEGVTLEIHKR